jgi:predicted short-subunit dehydrogenase-like oxidoreductase (DUF2520 family)
MSALTRRGTASARSMVLTPDLLARSRSLTVGIIGAGRVGSALGAALERARHRVTAATGVSAVTLQRISTLLPGARVVTPVQVAPMADVIVIAVPDDALAGVVRGLADSGRLRSGQIVVHTSGAHGLAVLVPVEAAGARPLALHPAMTFVGQPTDVERLAGVSYGVTAPADLHPLATRLVADLGGSIEWVDENHRAMYHAGLAHGANHLVTLVNEAMDLLRDAGVRHPDRVLGPLLRASLENTLRHGDAALTGPIGRGDAGTVARHLTTIQATAPDSVTAYLALARRTADRAIASGRLRAGDAEPLLGVLAEGWAPMARPAAGSVPGAVSRTAGAAGSPDADLR